MQDFLTPSERTALYQFETTHDQNWKAALRKCWESGNYSGVITTDRLALQNLRNSRRFGPRGLIKYGTAADRRT